MRRVLRNRSPAPDDVYTFFAPALARSLAIIKPNLCGSRHLSNYELVVMSEAWRSRHPLPLPPFRLRGIGLTYSLQQRRI